MPKTWWDWTGLRSLARQVSDARANLDRRARCARKRETRLSATQHAGRGSAFARTRAGPRTVRGDRFDAWAYPSKETCWLAWCRASLAMAPEGTALSDRARDVVAQINRLDFSDANPGVPARRSPRVRSSPWSGCSKGLQPFCGTCARGARERFAWWLKGSTGCDRMCWQVLDGIRLMIGTEAEVAVLVAVGAQATEMAARYAEGDLPGANIDQVLNDLFDLSITIPSLEVRRIGSMLQRHLGADEAVLRRAFGPDAVRGLAAAVAHRPLGSPRLIYRLVQRVLLLAEYALESQNQRELTEAQWCWVIVSERWPAFRRTMIRGGKRRWKGLSMAVTALARRRRLRPTTARWPRCCSQTPF